MNWICSDATLRRLFGQMVLAFLAVNILFIAYQSHATAETGTKPVHIVALGDSLTAGYGLPASGAFPVQLEAYLKQQGLNVVVDNAGVSGDTTAGGLERLDWAVPDGTDAVILELGANDALRGLPTAQIRANLKSIIEKLKGRGISILLAGMRAPRNLGNDYANAFDRIFPELADEYDLLLYPFFLTGVVLDPKLNLSDGMHPSVEGVGVIVRRIAPFVEQLIDQQHERQPG
jgi:acyl-CoA thioesterase I